MEACCVKAGPTTGSTGCASVYDYYFKFLAYDCKLIVKLTLFLRFVG